MTQVVRSTRIVIGEEIRPADILIKDGKICELAAWKSATAEVARDFGDRVILPGLIDPHVHINDPGRDWEGFETATSAAAAGGITTLVDMPLNCIPETINVNALEAKRTAARNRSYVDWTAWGGVVRGNQKELLPLKAAGVPGFKCFLIHSGIDGFEWVDEASLRAALSELRGVPLPLLAHAELAGPIEAATRALENRDWRSYATYLASRPDAAEISAIELLIRLAAEYDAWIHVVHLSSAAALPLIKAARARGLKITVETCAHYLWFAAEEISDGALELKCAPPIRSRANREELWHALESGLIDFVVTDHSPSPAELKRGELDDIPGHWNRAWGGIAGLGFALPVLWTTMSSRGIALERIQQWMGSGPATLAGLDGRKGRISAGNDADFCVFDPDHEWRVTTDDLHFRHKISPYLGAKLRGKVRSTWLRGVEIFDGKMLTVARGEELTR